jgi:hypothetical protein
MRRDSGSYVIDVLFATHSPRHGASALARQLRRMTASVLDPYRPELHYMRGPGRYRLARTSRSSSSQLRSQT